MPIRAEHRKYYGRAFKNYRLQLIAAAGGEICSKCGRTYVNGINGAHQNHDPRDLSSVVLMCPRCHATHDAPHRIAIMRRRKAQTTGQLWLLPELEWSPFASWEIPAWVYDLIRQRSLFFDQEL